MPNFDYNRDVPDAPNNPSDDQPDMKINTNSIDSIIAVDHYGFKNNNGGFHKQVHLINEAAPGLAGASGVLYANTGAGNSWPIWQNALGSTFMMTSITSNTTNGYTSLPGGLLLQWGAATLDNNGMTIRNDSPFVFPKPFPVSVFSVQISAAKGSTGAEGLWISDGTLTTTGFSIKTSASSGQFTTLYFLAIGREV